MNDAPPDGGVLAVPDVSEQDRRAKEILRQRRESLAARVADVSRQAEIAAGLNWEALSECVLRCLAAHFPTATQPRRPADFGAAAGDYLLWVEVPGHRLIATRFVRPPTGWRWGYVADACSPDDLTAGADGLRPTWAARRADGSLGHYGTLGMALLAAELPAAEPGSLPF